MYVKGKAGYVLSSFHNVPCVIVETLFSRKEITNYLPAPSPVSSVQPLVPSVTRTNPPYPSPAQPPKLGEDGRA